MGQGSQCGAHVVQSSGVNNEIDRQMAVARVPIEARLSSFPLNASAIQQVNPSNIIDTPITFSTSTRNKSVHGAHPHAITYSCKRNKNPSARISAPREMVVLAISAGVVPFRSNLSITKAIEIPAKKRNKGAGKVPTICDHIKKVDFFTVLESHAS